MRKIRSLELFASGKSRGVGKRRIQDQGALPEQRRAAPRRRNGVSMDAGANEYTYIINIYIYIYIYICIYTHLVMALAGVCHSVEDDRSRMPTQASPSTF